MVNVIGGVLLALGVVMLLLSTPWLGFGLIAIAAALLNRESVKRQMREWEMKQ